MDIGEIQRSEGQKVPPQQWGGGKKISKFPFLTRGVVLLGLEFNQSSATPQHGHREGGAGKREESTEGGTIMHL